MKRLLTLAISCFLITGCDKKQDETPPVSAAPAVGAAQNQEAITPATRPDNSGINTRDRDPNAITPAVAGQGKSDVEMAADLRRRIMAGKMSVNAENVKVVFQSGKVTLRGPVNTQDEKDNIARMAGDVAGAGNVDNQLEVKAN